MSKEIAGGEGDRAPGVQVPATYPPKLNRVGACEKQKNWRV